jgi:hypothetical protein
MFGKVLILIVWLGLSVVNRECTQDVVDFLTDLGSCSITDQDIHGPEFLNFIHDAYVHAFVALATRIHGPVVGLSANEELCVSGSVGHCGMADGTVDCVHGHWCVSSLDIEGRVRCLQGVPKPKCLSGDDSP